MLEDESDDIAFLRGSGTVVTEAQLLESLTADGQRTILTIRWNTGEVRDYLFSAILYQVLSFGSQLLTILYTQPATSIPREGSEQEPRTGAYIDEETQTIWVWETETLDPRYLEALARRWSKWQVHGHIEGLVRHVVLSGRDAAAISISKQQAI